MSNPYEIRSALTAASCLLVLARVCLGCRHELAADRYSLDPDRPTSVFIFRFVVGPLKPFLAYLGFSVPMYW